MHAPLDSLFHTQLSRLQVERLGPSLRRNLWHFDDLGKPHIGVLCLQPKTGDCNTRHLACVSLRPRTRLHHLALEVCDLHINTLAEVQLLSLTKGLLEQQDRGDDISHPKLATARLLGASDDLDCNQALYQWFEDDVVIDSCVASIRIRKCQVQLKTYRMGPFSKMVQDLCC